MTPLPSAAALSATQRYRVTEDFLARFSFLLGAAELDLDLDLEEDFSAWYEPDRQERLQEPNRLNQQQQPSRKREMQKEQQQQTNSWTQQHQEQQPPSSLKGMQQQQQQQSALSALRVPALSPQPSPSCRGGTAAAAAALSSTPEPLRRKTWQDFGAGKLLVAPSSPAASSPSVAFLLQSLAAQASLSAASTHQLNRGHALLRARTPERLGSPVRRGPLTSRVHNSPPTITQMAKLSASVDLSQAAPFACAADAAVGLSLPASVFAAMGASDAGLTAPAVRQASPPPMSEDHMDVDGCGTPDGASIGASTASAGTTATVSPSSAAAGPVPRTLPEAGSTGVSAGRAHGRPEDVQDALGPGPRAGRAARAGLRIDTAAAVAAAAAAGADRGPDSFSGWTQPVGLDAARVQQRGAADGPTPRLAAPPLSLVSLLESGGGVPGNGGGEVLTVFPPMSTRPRHGREPSFSVSAALPVPELMLIPELMSVSELMLVPDVGLILEPTQVLANGKGGTAVASATLPTVKLPLPPPSLPQQPAPAASDRTSSSGAESGRSVVPKAPRPLSFKLDLSKVTGTGGPAPLPAGQQQHSKLQVQERGCMTARQSREPSPHIPAAYNDNEIGRMNWAGNGAMKPAGQRADDDQSGRFEAGTRPPMSPVASPLPQDTPRGSRVHVALGANRLFQSSLQGVLSQQQPQGGGRQAPPLSVSPGAERGSMTRRGDRRPSGGGGAMRASHDGSQMLRLRRPLTPDAPRSAWEGSAREAAAPCAPGVPSPPQQQKQKQSFGGPQLAGQRRDDVMLRNDQGGGYY